VNKQQGMAHQGCLSIPSLVLPSNRGSMDVRYFQVQLCSLVKFSHLVHPEDMSPKSMSVTDVSEALPPHGFGVPECIPKGSTMTPTTRDVTVRETYTQSTVRSD